MIKYFYFQYYPEIYLVSSGKYIYDNNFYDCKLDFTSDTNGPVTCKKDTYGLFNGIFIFKEIQNSYYSYMEITTESSLSNISNLVENDIYIYNCKNGKCNIGLNDGLNIISFSKKDNIEYITIENLDNNIKNKQSIHLINYSNNNGKIEATLQYGYIKDKNDFYTISANNLKSEISNINKSAQNTNDCFKSIGSIIQVQGSGSYYLCLSDDQSIKFESTTGVNYLLDASSSNNIFTNINDSSITHIVLKTIKNGFIFDNEISNIMIKKKI